MWSFRLWKYAGTIVKVWEQSESRVSISNESIAIQELMVVRDESNACSP